MSFKPQSTAPRSAQHKPQYQTVETGEDGTALTTLGKNGALYEIIVKEHTEYQLDREHRSRLEDVLYHVATRAPDAYAVAHKRSKGMTPIGTAPCLFWCPKCTCAVGLYVCTIALELTAVLFGVLHGAKLIREKKRPTNEVVIMQILLCLSFAIKVPYLRDKALALVTLGVLIIGYGVIAAVLLVAANQKGAT